MNCNSTNYFFRDYTGYSSGLVVSLLSMTLFGSLYGIALTADELYVPNLHKTLDNYYARRGRVALPRMRELLAEFVEAWGSSLPDVMISIVDVVSGGTKIGIGTMVGSGMFNLLIIPSLCLLLGASTNGLKYTLPLRMLFIMCIGLFIIIMVYGISNPIMWYNGWYLISVYIFYMIYSFYSSTLSKEREIEVNPTDDECDSKMIKDLTSFSSEYSDKKAPWLVLLSLCLITLLSVYTVFAAKQIGCYLDIPEIIMGSLILAAGTSAPDAATSLAESRRVPHGLQRAMCASYGANVFDMFMGIGLTWVFSITVREKSVQLLGNAVTLQLIFFACAAILSSILLSLGAHERRFDNHFWRIIVSMALMFIYLLYASSVIAEALV